jgi:hypothetical protein
MPKGRKSTKRTEAPTDPVQAMLEELRSQKVLIEDMRSENRLTAETVNAKVDSLAQKLDDGLRESRERDALLEAAIRNVRTTLKADIVRVETTLKTDIVRVETTLKTDIVRVETTLKADIVRVETTLRADIARVEAKVDKLVPLEDRVATLERRLA